MKVEDNEMSSSQAAPASPPTRSRKQSNPLPSSSPDLPWAYIPTVKLEPIDDTRNDSGVASGSECPSASPSSDRSDSHPYNTPPQDLMANGSYQRVSNPSNPYNAYYHSNFGTPSKVTSPAQSVQAISPSVSPQITATAPTPAASKTPRGKYNFDDIAIPKMNSHGKIKLHKCKQCEFVACTKVDFWEHSVIHIRPEKALRCKDCPFITEFKHHMEYHIMNHTGTKPYKCQLCPYSCVNNSMLRSHMKSHSKIYQYRCEDCLYETKYVHSLKLHLRKYQHKPAVVLNPDGTPNPEPVIDVYGSRRGPKSKKILQKTPPPTTTPPTSAPTSPVQTPAEQQLVPPPPPHLLQYNPLVMSQNGMLPFPIPLIPLANPDLFQNIQMIKEQLMRMAQLKSTVEAPPAMDTALDLSKSPPRPSMNGGEDDSMTTAFENVEVVDNSETQHCNATSQTEIAGFSGQGINYNYHCHFCGVGFSREEIYRIHMDYHGYRVPFLCNMCGYECADCISFFKHIAKSAH